MSKVISKKSAFSVGAKLYQNQVATKVSNGINVLVVVDVF